MQNDLVYFTSEKVLGLFRDSLAKHPAYRDNVKAFSQYTMNLKERPQVGVKVTSASATRMKLSPDDKLSELHSYATLLPHPGTDNAFIEWVWENRNTATTQVKLGKIPDAWVSADRKKITWPAGQQLTQGLGNLDPASGYGAVSIYVNKAKRLYNISHNVMTLQAAVPAGAEILASYTYSSIVAPGYYFVTVSKGFGDTAVDYHAELSVKPLYEVPNEVVVDVTTGLEVTATLAHGAAVVFNKAFALYTQRFGNSNKFYLEPNVDYTVDVNGVITFLAPLAAGSRLIANYRYWGTPTGPFKVMHQHFAMVEALPGVTIALGDKIAEGDVQVVCVTKERERSAAVYGSHYEVNVSATVFARDKQTSSQVADHLISDIWGNNRFHLSGEGFHLEDMDFAGDSTDSYVDATGEQNFNTDISMRFLTEWKRFVPYIGEIAKFDLSVYMGAEFESLAGNGNAFADTAFVIDGEGFTATTIPKGPFFF